jgi:GST-like protein
MLYGSAEFLAVHEYTNVIRWADQIAKRPAVQRGRIVNSGQNGIAERHEASDIDKKLSESAKAAG